MIRNRFKGLGIALVTPFTKEGKVDFTALRRLLDYQLSNGIDFICLLGTTAETPTLSAEERQQVKDLVVEKVNGISAAAATRNLSVVLYNVPGRVGVNMTAETTRRLANECENIVAIKEASGNFTQIDDIIKNKPANFDVISGDDGITFPLITLGAVGVISVIGNALPKEFSRMVRLALNGDYQNALTIHHKFTELFKLLFVDGNPAGVKAMLNSMGLIENELRLPLVPSRISTMEKISAIVKELNIKC